MFGRGTDALPQTRIEGLRKGSFSDAYYFLMRAPWWVVLVLFSLGFLAVNALFGVGYLWVGGIANAQPGSFSDAFFFSVQTLGTIGYGGMSPSSFAAHLL